MEYNITKDLNVNTYNENIDATTPVRKSFIGDDIYFYPDENGNLITLTKLYESVVAEPRMVLSNKKNVDFITQFFVGSVAVIGLFVLFKAGEPRSKAGLAPLSPYVPLRPPPFFGK
jgi:hypothetical protein